MINIDQLNKDEKIFIKEFNIYNNSIKFINENILNCDENVKSSFSHLSDEYLKLLYQAIKLVKISDSSQLKLRNAQLKLKEQNDKIEEQNHNLIIANKEKDDLLGIINKELSKAADYVKSLLPKPIDDLDFKLKINYKYEPSSKLGGDMFGYQMYDDENLIMFLFDVCGHGIGPALYSVSVFNAINNRNLINVDFLSPASVFNGLNSVFNMRAHNDMYFTMWYGVLNLKTLKIKYSNAGHPHPILVTDNNINYFPECDNFFIGGFPNWKYTENIYQLKRRDNFYLFSDGVFEVRKNETEYHSVKILEDYITNNIANQSICNEIYEYILNASFDKIIDDDFFIS